ncbi:MAG TPA: hypothetical protein PK970_10595 [Hyphomicrobiaceae bacterium]|nr:hypothetical protein [Hyphomicrobiaceae bacterium]
MTSDLVYVATALMAVLTAFIAGVWLSPRLRAGRIVYDTTPDRPIGFGPEMTWLAVKSGDTFEVAAALGVEHLTPANWSTGLGTVHDNELGDGRVFFTPPVDGWTLVVGRALPVPLGKAFVDKCTPLLATLGRRFPEAQMFAVHDAIDYVAWARASRGAVERGVACSDVDLVWSVGATTAEERALGLKGYELRGVEARVGDAGGRMLLRPTEAHVLALAAKWSLDPMQLDVNRTGVSSGFVALAPRDWRMERSRSAA